MGELDGKVAVVTGGSRGIGRATVELFAREGATIAICARNEGPLRLAADELSARYGCQALACAADVRSQPTVDAFVARIASAYGRVDILVNNAGESEQHGNEKVSRSVATVDTIGQDLPPGRFVEMSNEEYLNAFERKFFGMLRVTRAAVPLMQKAGGSIVNITSIKGNQAPPRVGTSGIAWAACLNWSKTLSMELGAENIRVNVVSVGGIMTPNLLTGYERWGKGMSIDEYYAPRTANIPLRRLGTPEEVAQAIYFLASPRSAYISGQCLAIDGGGLRSF